MAPFFLSRTAKQIEVAQAELRDGYGVVLPPELAAVVEQRNALLVKRPCIIGLLHKRHVVLPQSPRRKAPVHLRIIVPKRKVAVAPPQVRGEDSPIIVQTMRKVHGCDCFAALPGGSCRF